MIDKIRLLIVLVFAALFGCGMNDAAEEYFEADMAMPPSYTETAKMQEAMYDEEYAEVMKNAGVPDFAIPIVVGIQESIRNGSLEVENSDFEQVLGRPLTPINDGLAQLVSK